MELQRLDRSPNAWMRMTNKPAKAVVPALIRVVDPVAVCQRGIVGVSRVWWKGRRDATQAHWKHSIALRRCCRRLRALDPPSRSRIEVVNQVMQLMVVGHV